MALSASSPRVKRHSSSMRKAVSTESISLTTLLSTCVDACSRGCAEIRAVQSRRALGGELSVSRKDEDDAKSALTEADLAAQSTIVTALSSEWPGIKIVGEEDGNEALHVGSISTSLRQDLCSSLANSQLQRASLGDVTIFVDPLDGTREFVEGRLGNVQSLVGIAINGRAIAGAVGLPFPGGDLSSDTAVVYGLVGAGAGVFGVRPPCSESLQERPIVIAGDSKNDLLTAAQTAALANGGSSLIEGGAGNKLLAVAERRADLAIMHFGTSLWDTCATEAVLRSMGGLVTDIFGAPLIHSSSPPPGDLKNSLGVIASAADCSDAHKRLCAAMRADQKALSLLKPWMGAESSAGPQAVDVARCLEGRPLSTRWLGDQLGGHLQAYVAPEAAAARGMMSDACRLELSWAAEDAKDGAATLPSSVYYKRVVMGDLEHARTKAKNAPLKLARDVRSYAVEAAFLASPACADLVSSGIRVARAYCAELRPCAEDPIESRFSMLLQDFSEKEKWRQEGMLDYIETRAALKTFARLHAFFWSGSRFWERGSAQQLEAAIWPSGGYWQPGMQPKDQFLQLAEKWKEHYAAFGTAFSTAPELAAVDLPSLGTRLQQVALEMCARAHPFDAESGGDAERSMPQRTLIHGDPKAANIFLRHQKDHELGDSTCEVGLIDFQWCGFGLAATEVAHFLCAAVRPECLTNKGDEQLLDHYHSVLCNALTEFGVAANAEDAATRIISRAQLQEQYEVAVLDTCRLVFGYQWSRADFGRDALNRNSYNKSLQSALWLTARCDALLKERESKTLYR